MRKIIVQPDRQKQIMQIAALVLFNTFNIDRRVVVGTSSKEELNRLFSEIRSLIKLASYDKYVKRNVSAPWYEIRFLTGTRIRGFSLGNKRGEGCSMLGQDASDVFVLNGNSVNEKSWNGTVFPLLASCSEANATVFVDDLEDDSLFAKFTNWEIINGV